MTAVRTFVAFVALVAAVGCGAAEHKKIQRQSEELRLELAEVYLAKGAKHAAAQLLRRELAERPQDIRVRTLYGSVLRDIGLYEQAEAELEMVLRHKPDHAPAHAGLGILFDLTGEPKLARKHHVRACRLERGNAQYWNNLGFSLLMSGELEKAVKVLEQALARNPSLGIAYNNLGFAYGRLGDFERAENAFRQAGSQAATKLNLSIVYQEHGDMAQARKLRRQAYALAPDLKPEEDEK